MRIRISHPHLSSDLLRFLQQRVDVVGGRVNDDELEVSILGSRRLSHDRMELEQRLRPWRAANPHVAAAVVD